MTETVLRRDLRLLLRCAPLALVPPLLLASTFPGEYRVPLGYWSLSLAAALLMVVGARWPVPVSVAVSALAIPLFTADAWGVAGLVPYLGAVACAEAVMRTHSRWQVALVTGCWAAAVLIDLWFGYSDFWRPATALESIAYIGLPLLLGLYLRAQSDLAEKFRLEAVAAESRRAAAELHTRTAERSAMARELHDLVAHHIASILLRIEVARHVLADPDPRVVAVLDDVHDTAADALADIRRLLVALRDPTLGGVALVESDAVPLELAAAVDRARAAGFDIDADISADPGDLDAIGRLTLLRVVQESLTNVMKHADRTAPVELAVTHRDGGIAVRVRSAGRAAAAPGHGIVGMRERVDLVGGVLNVGPTEDGWTVEAWLPGIRVEVSR
ncbi:sensor histidine kinase [Nocardia sp. NPDC050406]|uniref:sensor histidine kinase n=1 Tax=Nocardia sp. NPDC050406 TaxID=3364318 RepID=UPI0037BC27E0